MKRLAATLLLSLWLPVCAAAPPPDGAGEHRGHRHGAQATPEGVSVPSWRELSPAQQEQLAKLREVWDQMPASRRVRALERLERRERWESLTPEQRERLREGARNFRDLPPELREKMRNSMRAMRELPEAERRALWDQWRAMDPAQRRAWLEAGGPGLAPAPEG